MPLTSFCGSVGRLVKMNLAPEMFAYHKLPWGTMPVGIIQSLPCQIIHVFICGFVSRVRGGHSMHSACLVLLSHFYVIRVGSGHLCCFPCRPPIDQPYFALCPSMPDFPLLLREDLVMCCIETYLACGPTNQSSKDFEDSCVQLKSCLHV